MLRPYWPLDQGPPVEEHAHQRIAPEITAVDDRILGGTMSQNTKRVISEQLSDVKDPVQARALAVGLAIGGPEFQRQ